MNIEILNNQQKDNINNNYLDNNNEIVNYIEANEVSQKSFLETTLGRTINGALDIGLRAVLPDLIENQIIEIKDTLLKEGLKEGITKTIDKAIDFGKSTLGIITGKFDNISQVQTAVEKGGIVDTFSNIFDGILNKVSNKGLINKNISNLIKKGKNLILDNVTNNIQNILTDQVKAIEKLNNHLEKWNNYYLQRDFNNMEKEFKNIKTQLNKLIPLEETLRKSREIENLHNLIKNNGQDFNLSIEQLELSRKLA